jgi:hypothetical protein
MRSARFGGAALPRHGRLHSFATPPPSFADPSASGTRWRLLSNPLKSSQLAPPVVEHSQRFAAGRTKAEAMLMLLDWREAVAQTRRGRILL